MDNVRVLSVRGRGGECGVWDVGVWWCGVWGVGPCGVWGGCGVWGVARVGVALGRVGCGVCGHLTFTTTSTVRSGSPGARRIRVAVCTTPSAPPPRRPPMRTRPGSMSMASAPPDMACWGDKTKNSEKDENK